MKTLVYFFAPIVLALCLVPQFANAKTNCLSARASLSQLPFPFSLGTDPVYAKIDETFRPGNPASMFLGAVDLIAEEFKTRIDDCKVCPSKSGLLIEYSDVCPGQMTFEEMDQNQLVKAIEDTMTDIIARKYFDMEGMLFSISAIAEKFGEKVFTDPLAVHKLCQKISATNKLQDQARYFAQIVEKFIPVQEWMNIFLDGDPRYFGADGEPIINLGVPDLAKNYIKEKVPLPVDELIISPAEEDVEIKEPQEGDLDTALFLSKFLQ